MYRIKSELEDLCLRYLQPDIYQQLKQKVARKKGKREREVERVIKALRRLLGEVGVEARVYGRAKNFYSIYKKMIKKGLRFEDIHDLSAIRVIVRNTDECYAALQAIHAKWKPVSGRFDDYIQNPKPNLYQSLHTEILFNNKPVEVQVRTGEMHHVAEEGIAAHWQYKETERDKKFDRKIGWLKQILDWRSRETASDLVESFKIDIFKDEIYVLTPKGDPIPLPEKATPVDFAFAVHTEIGERCRAAKVNGVIQPLDHELNSGDVVEIVTARNAKPSRQWLNFVRTSFAREKVRKALGLHADPSKTPTRQVTTPEEIDDDRQMRIAHCCYIRKGDDIVGIRSKDGATVVHSKKHCEHVRDSAKDKQILLSWKKEERQKKQIEVELKDRSGIFADILGKLTAEDITLNAVTTKTAKKQLRMLLSVSGSQEKLDKILPKIKQVKDVVSARAV
jgi:(p)ppGpp synthase/HD superfamily hydrolase